MTFALELRLYRERLLQANTEAVSRADRVVALMQDGLAQSTSANAEISRMAGYTDAIGRDVAALASAFDWYVPQMLEELATVSAGIGAVAELLANPSATAAAELYRRGCYALESGWSAEAIRDLTESIDKYPYNPSAWFKLALAHPPSADPTSAIQCLRACVRYGVRTDKVTAASALLAASSLLRAHDRTGEAEELLLAHVGELDTCAELHLSLAVHHGRHQHARRALLLHPALAELVSALCVDPNVGEDVKAYLESAAADVATEPDGPPGCLRRVAAAIDSLLRSAHTAGIPVPPFDASNLDVEQSSPLSTIVTAHRVLPVAVDYCRRLLDGLARWRRDAATTIQELEKAVRVLDGRHGSVSHRLTEERRRFVTLVDRIRAQTVPGRPEELGRSIVDAWHEAEAHLQAAEADVGRLPRVDGIGASRPQYNVGWDLAHAIDKIPGGLRRCADIDVKVQQQRAAMNETAGAIDAHLRAIDDVSRRADERFTAARSTLSDDVAHAVGRLTTAEAVLTPVERDAAQVMLGVAVPNQRIEPFPVVLEFGEVGE